ncbi:MAG: pyridoxamine 5'-phosphate oxidase [Ideonella sp.]
MSNRLTDLSQIETALWCELASAAADRNHEWRTPVLATMSSDETGSASVDARTIVLREVDIENRQFQLYTDSRAQKVAQLSQEPQAMLVMWSRLLGWQLRCRIVCEVAEDGLVVSSHWTRIKLTSAAQDYLAPLAPGEPIGAQPPVLAQREHFALVTARVVEIDWLELHADGHRRARFAGGKGSWVQP